MTDSSLPGSTVTPKLRIEVSTSGPAYGADVLVECPKCFAVIREIRLGEHDQEAHSA